MLNMVTRYKKYHDSEYIVMMSYAYYEITAKAISFISFVYFRVTSIGNYLHQ